MVEEGDLQKAAGIVDTAGLADVGDARGRAAGRVVMGHDHGRGIAQERTLEEPPRVDGR